MFPADAPAPSSISGSSFHSSFLSSGLCWAGPCPGFCLSPLLFSGSVLRVEDSAVCFGWGRTIWKTYKEKCPTDICLAGDCLPARRWEMSNRKVLNDDKRRRCRLCGCVCSHLLKFLIKEQEARTCWSVWVTRGGLAEWSGREIVGKARTWFIAIYESQE